SKHALATQKFTNKELFSWLPVFAVDCKKVHDLCQKILVSEDLGSQYLKKMSDPLTQIALKLESAEKDNLFKNVEEILDCLHSEIYEIQQTVQLKESLSLTQKLQSEFEVHYAETPSMEEAMKPLRGYHFQSLKPQNNLELDRSNWKLNCFRNVTLAALLCLRPAAPRIGALNINEHESLNPRAETSHAIELVSSASLSGSMAKVDVLIHNRKPLGTTQVRELRQEVALASRAISSTSSFTALPEWPNHFDETCYDLDGFEQSIGRLMNEARQFLWHEDWESAEGGNKHLNLIKQAQLVEGLNLQGIVVPIPHAVYSDKVTQFLQKLVPELFEEWAKLGARYENYKEISPFLEKSEAQEHLKIIDQMIEKAFNAAGANPALFQELVSPEFQAWLETIKKNDNYLMVRSTGSEDSRETANAGGNVSRNYVSPNAVSLTKAMGDVVRSYFSYSSLQNRINAKLNPFDSELKLAVMAQELIGEPIGGSLNPLEIPISLVLFSTEPLYVGGEKFRALRISGTYGHGEGVVGNQGIATDTVLILISESHPDKLYILYDNQDKPERLAPILTPNGIRLEKTPNPPSMQTSRVFDESILHRLYLWGVLGEKFFDNHPTDMEIVIKGKTIFPVQARPVNRPDLLPSYINLKKIGALKENPIIEKVQGEVLVPGLGSVVMIENPEELIFTSTLEEAEKKFQKDLHKAVVVSRPEPANSHPVVNFSGLGIPCIFASQGIQEILSHMDKDYLIAIDMQTGVLNLWDRQLGSIVEYISQGFAVHPAKIAISLPLAANIPIPQQRQQVPQDIKDLILDIRTATTQEVAISKLKTLRHHEWLQNAKKHEQGLIVRLKNMEFIPRQLGQGLTLTTQLLEKIDEAFNEAEVVFGKNSEERLRPLFYVKVIENLLVKSSRSGSSLSQYSVKDIAPLHKNLNALVDYQKALSHPAHFADLFMFGSQGLVPSAEMEWRTFLKDLESLVQSKKISQDQVTHFKQMLETLETIEMLPSWYTFFFSKISGSNLTLSEKFDKLLETLPASETLFLNYFLNLHQTLKTSQGNIDLFSQPKSFQNGWRWLQDHVVKFKTQTLIGSESLAIQLKHTSPISKIIIFKVMQELVNTYDLSIKAMKASSAWSQEEKVPIFKKMLKPYLNIFLDWGKNIADPAYIPMHSEWPIANYLDKMNQIFEDLNFVALDSIHLLPSSDFSVVAAMIGSGTEFNRHFPKHLEDIFSLIHQNLLTILSSSSSQMLDDITLQQAFLPELFKKMLTEVNSIKYEKNIQRIGMELNSEVSVFKYNIPLRSHSAQVWLEYDNHSNEVTLKSFLLGEGRTRWEKGRIFLWALDKFGLLPLSKSVYSSQQELSFVWKIKDLKTIPIAIEELNFILEMSFDYNLEKNIIQTLIDRRKISNNEIIEFAKSPVKKPDIKIILKSDVFEELFLLNTKEIKQLLYTVASAGIKDIDEQNRINSLKLFEFLFSKQEGYAEAEKAVIDGLNKANANVHHTSLNLLKVLVQNDKSYSEAEAAAISGMNNSDKKIHIESLDILKALVEKGKSYDAAKTAVRIGLKDLDAEVYIGTLELLKALVVKGESYELAEFAAVEGLNQRTDLNTLRIDLTRKNHHDIQIIALNILKALVEKGESYSVAETAVIEGIEETDEDVRVIYLNILQALVEKGESYDISKKYIVNLILKNDEFIATLYLLKALVEKGECFKQAGDAANKAILKSINLRPNQMFAKGIIYHTKFRLAAINIFQTLIEKQNFAAAFETIKNFSDDDVIIDLFKLLFEKGEGFVEAEIIANKNMQFDTRAIGLKIFQLLIKKGMSLVAAENAAGIAILDRDPAIRNIAFSLFQTLFESGRGIAAAEAAASIGIVDYNPDIRENSFDLFKILFETEQGNRVAMRHPLIYISFQRGLSY
ncbi:MAG: hypothetical protein H0X29_04645, partial [Parachlamydiaceae bacterium]|nr:hypothetical protein [Parachlamydiaceae bacterium]